MEDRAPPTLEGLPPRYRPLRELGTGAYKTVYLATDTKLRRLVAIAAIRLESLDSDLGQLHEARAMAQIGDHAHVVSVYDVIESAQAVYIVSQYLPGGDLEGWMRAREAKPLALPEAVRIAADVCRALEHAHGCEMAHRDVKPANVLLDDEKRGFLADLGLATFVDASAGSACDVAGTPHYMAPEVIATGTSGLSADLYSLGCVLYEMLTGAPPFTHESPIEVLRMHGEKEPVPPVQRNRAVPALLSDLVVKFLQKDPASRPASSADVRASLEGLLASPLLEIAPSRRARLASIATARTSAGLAGLASFAEEPPLVCRGDEIALFDAAIARSRGGEPTLLVLEGDPGIGKTRLLRELRERAVLDGALVLAGAGYEDAPLPYRPFVEAILPAAGLLSDVDRDHAEELRRFLHLSDRAGSGRVEGGDRHRLFVAVFAALTRWSRGRPLVLTIDDLHWADAASLDLFEHIAFALCQLAARGPVALTLATSVRPTATARVRRAIERLQREPITKMLRPAGLDEAGVGRVLTSLGVERPSNQLVERVCVITDGNPLYVREVAEHLQRTDALEVRGGYTVCKLPSADIAIPSSLTSAIAGALGSVGSSCRQALATASIVGIRFGLREVSAISGLSIDECIEALDEAASVGILVDLGQSYRFAHPLLRRAVEDDVRPTRRQSIHLRAADHLERARSARPEETAARIAHHLLRAGPLAPPATVVVYARRAAEQALAQYAWAEASELLEAAIRATGEGADVAEADLADLHHKAGLAYFNRHDIGPCLQHLDGAIEGFGRAGDDRGLALALNDRTRAALENGLVSFGQLGETASLQSALERLGGTDALLEATLLGTLAESYGMARRITEAERLADRAIGLAQSEGADRLCSVLFVQRGLAHLQVLQLREALESYRSGAECARRAQNLLGLELCLQRCGLVLQLLGELAEAERLTLEARELNAIVHSGEGSWNLSTLVSLAVLRGDGALAERYASEALQELRRVRSAWSGPTLLMTLASSRAARDDERGANEAIDQLLEPGFVLDDPSPIGPHLRAFRDLILVDTGRAAELREATAPTAAPAVDSLDLSQLGTLCVDVELARATGARLADGTCEALAHAYDRGVLFTMG